MKDVLESILQKKKISVQKAKKENPENRLTDKIKSLSTSISLKGAIQKENRISLIAETKKKSPSAGLLRDPYDPAQNAMAYAKSGATAISVLTEQDHFDGEIEDLKKVRNHVSLPILRKDFIFDPYQIVEARAFGADAVLIIADMIDGTLINELVAAAREYSLEALVEVFDPKNLDKTLLSGSKLLGVNTRNLRTLEMNPNNLDFFSKEIPQDFITVAESGIKTPSDVSRVYQLGYRAVLVGESLLKQASLEQAVKMLLAESNNSL